MLCFSLISPILNFISILSLSAPTPLHSHFFLSTTFLPSPPPHNFMFIPSHLKLSPLIYLFPPTLLSLPYHITSVLSSAHFILSPLGIPFLALLSFPSPSLFPRSYLIPYLISFLLPLITFLHNLPLYSLHHSFPFLLHLLSLTSPLSFLRFFPLFRNNSSLSSCFSLLLSFLSSFL
jgi:hypothetical protein